MQSKIYTHDIAAQVLECFEDVLDNYGIEVPSPEDDDRDEEAAPLYGSVYSDLLDKIEELLIETLARHKTDTEVVPYTFSGEY